MREQVAEASQSSMSADQSQAIPQTGKVTIQSRFGEVVADVDHAIFFPQGLLGLIDNLSFVITDIPGRNMGQFRLLQCLNDHSVSFIVLPIDVDNRLIVRSDLEDACDALGVSLKNLLSLLIVSIKQMPEGVTVTANARAPVIIDTASKAGLQYVFPHNRYDVRTLLSK